MHPETVDVYNWKGKSISIEERKGTLPVSFVKESTR